MKFWYEVPCQFVTSDFGRYEAVRFIGREDFPVSRNRWARAANYTWTPVFAGPKEPDVLSSLSDFEYAQATCPV